MGFGGAFDGGENGMNPPKSDRSESCPCTTVSVQALLSFSKASSRQLGGFVEAVCVPSNEMQGLNHLRERNADLAGKLPRCLKPVMPRRSRHPEIRTDWLKALCVFESDLDLQHPVPIALSQLNCRVYRLQFRPCVVDLHLPVDAPLRGIDVG